MKKYLSILLIIFIIVLFLFINSMYSQKETALLFCQLSEKKSEISNRTSLQNNNLKITLKDFCTNGINEDNFLNSGLTQDDINKIVSYKDDCNCLIECASVDSTNISEISYDYLVYDNNKNILTTTLVYDKEKTQTNNFIKHFIKYNYNSDQVQEFNKHLLHLNTSNYIVKNMEKSILSLFTWNVDESKENQSLNLSKIHILIINPSYKNFKNDKIYLENTIFEFIIED